MSARTAAPSRGRRAEQRRGVAWIGDRSEKGGDGHEDCDFVDPPAVVYNPHVRAHFVASGSSLALAAFVAVAGGRPAGVLLLPILAGLVVPFASSSPRGNLGFAAALGLTAGGSACCAFTGFGGTKTLALLLMLGAFSLLLAAASSPARARRASPGVVLLWGAAPGFLLLGTVFYADPVIEATEGRKGTRAAVIAVAVGANPILVLAQHVCDEDLLHTSLYGRSTIGDHPFSYPDPWQPAAAFVGVAAALLGIARLVRRPDV